MGNSDGTSSITTEHPPHPTADGTGPTSRPPKAEGGQAISIEARNPRQRKREHLLEDCLKEIHCDTTDPNRTPHTPDGGISRAFDASHIEQDAKKRRQAAPSLSTDSRADADDTRWRHYPTDTLGRAVRPTHGHDAQTSGINRLSSVTEQQPRSRQSMPRTTRHKKECSKVPHHAGDANAAKHGDSQHSIMRCNPLATASRGTNVAEADRAHGRKLATTLGRNRVAMLSKDTAKADARSTEHARMRLKAGVHTARPRHDAGSVELHPSKRCGVHDQPTPLVPSLARADKYHTGHPPRPARRATKNPGKRPRQRCAMANATAIAQSPKVRRLDAPPSPVPDARLMGRGWHERWPPPARSSEGPATRLSL